MMKLTALLCFILVTTSCFSQHDKSNEMINFTNNAFKFQYPGAWTIDTSGQWGAVVILAPLENASDRFSENVNVLIQNLEGRNIDLETYKQLTEQQITDLATDGKIIQSAIVKKDKGESFRITYSMTQGVFKLMITSVCYIHDEQAYLVTFTSEIDHVDQYKIIGEKILDSFRLIR